MNYVSADKNNYFCNFKQVNLISEFENEVGTQKKSGESEAADAKKEVRVDEPEDEFFSMSALIRRLQ